MLQGIYNLHARLFGRPGMRRLNQFLINLGLRGLGVLNYKSERLSGERPLALRLVRLIDQPGTRFLDVGANEGLFSEDVLAHSQHLAATCFEPHPTTYARTAQRLARFGVRATVIDKAVGAEAGEVKLFDAAVGSGTVHASTLPEAFNDFHRSAAVSHDVPMVPLDQVAFEGRVALMKIDVEGLEIAVIRGAKTLIETNRTDYIITEFGELDVFSRTFLRDFFKELPDYDVYRILPAGRLLRLNAPYMSTTHELFAYQNILFARKGAPLS